MPQIAKYYLLILTICMGCMVKAQKPKPASSFLILKNINVVDVLTGKILPDQVVVVKDELIYFIGNSFSENITVKPKYIDGKGKYLCPGLWDMHFHLCWDKSNDTLLFPVLLKNGITGVRDMGGDLKMMNKFKVNPQYFRPDIYGSGPMIDGNPPVYADFSLPVDNNTNMPAILDSLKNNGADFFKTYSLVKENQLKEIAAYCRNHNINFAGHLSEYIEPEISISLGQKSIEHLNRLEEIWKINKARIDSIGTLMIAQKTFFCPTLITYQLKTRVRDTSIINNNYNKYIPASLMQEWTLAWKKRMARHTKLADWNDLDKTFVSQLELVDHLNKMGVLILGGSDFAGMPYVYPGISLHQELRLLVTAGLSNQEAIKTVTINPAIYMSNHSLHGSISAGKYADMLILERNPFDNIDNLKAIKFVIVKGEIFKDQE